MSLVVEPCKVDPPTNSDRLNIFPLKEKFGLDLNRILAQIKY